MKYEENRRIYNIKEANSIIIMFILDEDDNVVFIGHDTNVFELFRRHKKKGNRFAIQLTSKRMLNVEMDRLIKKYNPPYNDRLFNAPRYIGKQAARRMGDVMPLTKLAEALQAFVFYFKPIRFHSNGQQYQSKGLQISTKAIKAYILKTENPFRVYLEDGKTYYYKTSQYNDVIYYFVRHHWQELGKLQRVAYYHPNPKTRRFIAPYVNDMYLEYYADSKFKPRLLKVH